MKQILCVVALCITCSSWAAQFQSARPVWPEGREKEKNIFVGFRATVDAKQATLRLTASSL